MRNRRFKVTDVAAPDEDNPPLRRNTQPSMAARAGSGSEDVRPVPVMVYAAADHRISVHGQCSFFLSPWPC